MKSQKKFKYCMVALTAIATTAVLLLICDYLYHGIGVVIRVNDNSFTLSDVECHFRYDEHHTENVSSKSIKDGIKFKSHSVEQAAYEYTFCLEGNGIKVYPRISFSHDFANYDRYSLLIELTSNGDGTYSASVRDSDCVYYRCKDVQKEGIEFQIGP